MFSFTQWTPIPWVSRDCGPWVRLGMSLKLLLCSRQCVCPCGIKSCEPVPLAPSHEPPHVCVCGTSCNVAISLVASKLRAVYEHHRCSCSAQRKSTSAWRCLDSWESNVQSCLPLCLVYKCVFAELFLFFFFVWCMPIPLLADRRVPKSWLLHTCK